MKIVMVGSIAYDSVESPEGKVEDAPVGEHGQQERERAARQRRMDEVAVEQEAAGGELPGGVDERVGEDDRSDGGASHAVVRVALG